MSLTMSRAIYLAVFSNGARPAHFAIFIPTGSDTGHVGKVIHVTGTTATGFFLEFKRNYETIHLAQVNNGLISDTVGNGQPEQDTIARDRLESVATMVQPPGCSPKPFDPSALNCQNWMESYVERLVVEGFVPNSAISVLQRAPRRL